MSITSKTIAPAAVLFNRARLGFPRFCFEGAGGIGDDLLCTAVFNELKKRGRGGITFATSYPRLFERNPDVNKLVCHPRTLRDHWLRKGLVFVKLSYAEHDPVLYADESPNEHILIKMCRLAHLSGIVDLRPYFYLTEKEILAGKVGANQIVIQSSGVASEHFMLNKEWYPERFQEVCDELRLNFSVVQLGSKKDPKLGGAIDLRGKTSLRESAAIMANSLVFIGLVGFMMHLARAVDCRAVIVYGGREQPQQTGYIANTNLYSSVPCAPCWLYNSCDHAHRCMELITSRQVIIAVMAQIKRHGMVLEVQTNKI